MRGSGLIVGLLLCSSAGCTLVANTSRNLVNEPGQAFDDYRYQRKARSLARDAWTRCGKTDPRFSSEHFRDGFLDGYADFLMAGGVGDAPPAPPDRYRRVRFQTPAGLRAIEEYFAGFQLGADRAVAEGRRSEFIVPLLLPGPTLPESIEFTDRPAALSTPTPAETHEPLPAPRPATPPIAPPDAKPASEPKPSPPTITPITWQPRGVSP